MVYNNSWYSQGHFHTLCQRLIISLPYDGGSMVVLTLQDARVHYQAVATLAFAGHQIPSPPWFNFSYSQRGKFCSYKYLNHIVIHIQRVIQELESSFFFSWNFHPVFYFTKFVNSVHVFIFWHSEFIGSSCVEFSCSCKRRNPKWPHNQIEFIVRRLPLYVVHASSITKRRNPILAGPHTFFMISWFSVWRCAVFCIRSL